MHIVTLEFPGAPPEETEGDLHIHRVRVEVGNPDFLVWVFLFNHFMEKKLASLGKFDVVHAHDWLVAPSAIASKHFLNAPLMSTLHSTEFGRSQGLHGPSSYTIDGIEWWLTYESKKVIVASEAMAHDVCGYFKLPAEKVEVIPNGIDPARFSVEVDPAEVKRRIGVPEDAQTILFVGRLVPQKGAEFLIRAMPEVLRDFPKARLIVAGDGWQKDYLMKLAFSLGVDDYAKFLGFVEESFLPKLVKAADVLVVPSVYEPFGIVALEGMAAGVPVVVSKTGGLQEIVDHEVDGLWVYPRDPFSIAWGIRRILSDPAFAKKLAENGRKKVEEKYSWRKVALKTAELYREVIYGGS